jgi:EmrB/QacA subfamily drug resistance transporter
MDAATPPPVGVPLTHAQARLIVIGMMLPIFMGSVDQTILASALPSIGRQFGNFTDLPWLITTYLIAATATTPLYGKISDIRGRRFALAIALITYMAGSVVCALAPNMAALIVGRALHGIGGGGLTSTGMVVLGDVASPKDRATYYAYFSATYTTAGACGPLLGGLLADYVDWSAIFWLNIPLGLAAIVFTLNVMRGLPRHELPHRLDFLGAGLIVIATVAFMFAITSGGVRYAWTSSLIVGLLLLAAIVGALFIVRLKTAPEPLIPLSILRDPAARCSIAANSFGWGGVIALNVFLPIYLQDVLSMSATSAGLSMMVLMGVLNASAGFSSQLIGRHVRYKIVPLIGMAIATLAVVALAWQTEYLNIWTFEILLAVLGIGFGPLAPLTGVTLQNAVPPHQFGTAIGTMNFLRSLFATMLVTIFGAIVLRGGPGAAVAPASAFRIIFFMGAASLAATFVMMFLLEERPLRATQGT